MMNKPATVFLDLDGLLLVYRNVGASEQWYEQPEVVPGAKELLDELEKMCCCVVLVTARKKCCREVLKQMLAAKALHYDQLVMGVTSGMRVIVNDAKPGFPQTAVGVTLPRNEPIDWRRLCDAIGCGPRSGRLDQAAG